MANDYTTAALAFADISEGNYHDYDFPAMATFVTAASRLIDREVGRWDGFFYPSTSEVTLYYDGSGLICQPIEEFVSISAVAVSEQGGLSSSDYTAWVLNTDYIVKPYNYAFKGKPINELEIKQVNGTKGAWYAYPKSVSVTGIAGYSTTVPPVVALACRMQSVRWFMRAKQGYQDTGANVDIGSLQITTKLELDPDVKQLLWGLKLELQRG